MGDQIKYTQKLKGDKILVIGGSSGIGFAVAEALVENGSNVIISSSNQNRIDQKVDQLKKSYPSANSRISGHACDLGDESTLEQNIVDLLEKCGKLDHIIFTAGDKLGPSKIAETDFSQMRHVGMVRFFAPLLVAKYAAKYLNAGPKSSLTLTTGNVSEKPIANWAVIGSFATGLHGMTRGLALDLQPVRVNLVSPGAVETELWDNFGFTPEQKKNLLEERGSKVPTGRIADPADVAEAYLYLLKDHNITGSMISTNGGALLV